MEGNLEEIQARLEEEEEEWKKAGLDLGRLQLGNPSAVLFELSVKVQTLINILVSKGVATDEEFNIMFKTILLNDMNALRQNAPAHQSEQIRRQILEGLRQRIDLNAQKPPWQK